MKNFFNIPANRFTRKQQIKMFGFFTLLLVLFYGNSIQNGYSLDDGYAYTTNQLATSGLSDVKSIFVSPSFDYGNFKFGYRPISLLSFALENQLFGIDAKVSHTINLILYLLVTFLVFKVLIRLFPLEKIGLAICTSFLFLILPIHTEIVNNIKCRDELLMLVFGMMSILFWIRGKDKKGFYFLAILSILVSILCKKSAFVFLGIIPVVEFFRSNGNWKRSAIATGLMIMPLFLFKLVIRFIKTSKNNREYDFVENPLYGGNIEADQLVMVLESAWFYFKNLLFPTQFISYYGYKTIEIQNFGLGSVLAIILVIGLLTVSVMAIKKQNAFGFGAIVLLGCTLPYINLVVPMVGIVAERFISAASIGFAILMVYGVHYLIEKYGKPIHQKYAMIGLVLYAVGYFPVIQARNVEWNSQISVLEADVQNEPESVVLNNSLGNNYFYKFMAAKNRKDKAEFGAKALKYSQASVQVYPTAGGYVNRGTAEYKVYNQIDKAELSFKKALEMNPYYEDALNKISVMYMELNRRVESLRYYRTLIEKYPRKYVYYDGFVRQLCQKGQFDEAVQLLDTALSIEPNVPMLVLLKANVYNEMKEFDLALVWFQNSYRLDPTNKRVRSQINFLSNQLKKAE